MSSQMMGRLRYLQMKDNFQPSYLIYLEIEYNINFLSNYTLRVPLILTLNILADLAASNRIIYPRELAIAFKS
jgi:hypothetical protein